jgi:hypothetical protein
MIPGAYKKDGLARAGVSIGARPVRRPHETTSKKDYGDWS